MQGQHGNASEDGISKSEPERIPTAKQLERLTSEGGDVWRQFADVVHEWSVGVHHRLSAQCLQDRVPELAAWSVPRPEDAESLGLPIPDSPRRQRVYRIERLQWLA
jgi:hypothetical protein